MWDCPPPAPGRAAGAGGSVCPPPWPGASLPSPGLLLPLHREHQHPPHTHTPRSLQGSPHPPEPLTPSRRSSPRASTQSREERVGQRGWAHRAEPGGGDSGELGAQQALTFTLLTPSTAAAIAEARVLVCGWEAGRGARVLVGVALTQGPGGGRMRQWGQRVLIRGPTGAAVEVQGCEIWWEGRVGEGSVGRPSGDPRPPAPTHCCTGPRRRSSTAPRR